MKSRTRVWLAALMLLALSGMALLAVTTPSEEAAQAAAPDVQFSLPTLLKQEEGVRRESLPPSQQGPTRLTGPASPFQPLTDPIFGQNYRANTDPSPTLAQQEPSIAVNPTDPLNVVVAAKDEREGTNTKHVYIYTSTDGGVNWLNQRFPYRAPAPPYSSDPVVNFSDDGIVYVTSLPYGGGTAGIQITRSTDGGITFSTGAQVTSNTGSDKEWTWIDNYPSSPYYHNMYVAWRNFGGGAAIMLNRSTDRGLTWSADTPVDSSAYQFPMPVVLPNGDVLVTYMRTSGSIAHARSTNGGVSFAGAWPIANVIQPACPPDNPGCSIWRMNPIPSSAVNPTNGNMVVAWADGRPNNTATIYYSRGTQNATVWSAPAALAPPPGTDIYQVEPWVEADEAGTFHAIWYDDRDTPNTSIFHIYYSRSTDDGVTWSAPARISTAASDLRIGIPSGYNRAAGDYIQVTGAQGNVYAAWTDTRSGTGEDIYVVRGVKVLASTPTLTSTPTVTRTSTAYATTTCCNPLGNVTTTCTAPDTYYYDLALSSTPPNCGLTLSGPVDLYFEVSDNPGGNWTTRDHTSAGTVYIPPQQTVHVQGSFYEPSIPPPNSWYRVKWTMSYVNCLGGRYIDGYSAPAPLCPGATPTATTTSIATITTTPLPPTITVTAVPPTASPTSSPTPCTMQFQDVDATNPFYIYIRCLACRGVVSGYDDGTFRPHNNITRGQIAKVVSNAGGFTENPHPQIYQDVPPNHPFYEWINRLTRRGVMGGYDCGGPGEPCVNAMPYFRPQNNATRGQMSKIVSNAARFDDPVPPDRQTFTDVPPSHPFWLWIERLVYRNILGGYNCGDPGLPCDPNRRPYFLPYADVTRGQSSKIVANAFFPNCQVAARP